MWIEINSFSIVFISLVIFFFDSLNFSFVYFIFLFCFHRRYRATMWERPFENNEHFFLGWLFSFGCHVGNILRYWGFLRLFRWETNDQRRFFIRRELDWYVPYGHVPHCKVTMLGKTKLKYFNLILTIQIFFSNHFILITVKLNCDVYLM